MRCGIGAAAAPRHLAGWPWTHLGPQGPGERAWRVGDVWQEPGQALFSAPFGKVCRVLLQKMSRKSDNNNILDISLAQEDNRNSTGMCGLLIHPRR